MFLTNLLGAADKAMKPNREWLEKIQQKDPHKAARIVAGLEQNKQIRQREREAARA